MNHIQEVSRISEAEIYGIFENDAAGHRDALLDVSSAERDGLQDDAGQGEMDDDDDGDESSEDGYLEGVEPSEDNNWLGTAWGESGHAAQGGNMQAMGAASSRQRSCKTYLFEYHFALSAVTKCIFFQISRMNFPALKLRWRLKMKLVVEWQISFRTINLGSVC